MITSYSRELFYQQLAINIKGQARLQRYDAVAHLEASEDEHFWSRFFKRYAPDKKILFLAHSSNEKGVETSGVDHSFLFRKYLDKQFFICIDSDYRYLMREHNIDYKHFIFQTYTYSFENHHCVPQLLDEVCKQCCGLYNDFFDFDRFLKEYSRIVFDLFIWHLYFVQYDEKRFTKLEFRRIASLYPSSHDFDVRNNCNAVLRELQYRVNDKIGELREEYHYVNIKALQTKYMSLGIFPDNAFLFIRGHNIFDMICAVGNKVIDELMFRQKHKSENRKHITELEANRRSFEIELKNNLLFEGYPEIRRIKNEIEAFF
jgi:hypothetical protein